jgi:hypothetical protein
MVPVTSALTLCEYRYDHGDLSLPFCAARMPAEKEHGFLLRWIRDGLIWDEILLAPVWNTFGSDRFV